MDRRIINVNELRVTDIPIVGGKGANLGELTSAAFPVPNAFVLTTVAYDYFLTESGISDRIEEELLNIDRTSDQSLIDASLRIRELFETYEIPTT